MTNLQKVRFLYWVIDEWLQYEVLRKNNTLRDYIRKCFIMANKRAEWYEYTKQLHRLHKQRKRRNSKEAGKWDEKKA